MIQSQYEMTSPRRAASVDASQMARAAHSCFHIDFYNSLGKVGIQHQELET